jgi:hypothetical protein
MSAAKASSSGAVVTPNIVINASTTTNHPSTLQSRRN